MQPEAAKYLWDALTASERVQRFVNGRTFDDYLADEILRSAVERQFGIVGEALSQLRKLTPTVAEQLEALPRIVDFRNVLIHGYATIDNTLVWGFVDTHLSVLVAQLKGLLATPNPPR
jgi:uncharacterized protein with HEPN domain